MLKACKNPAPQKPNWDKVWKFLSENYGIHNVEEFRAAQKNMEPLNIGLMVAPDNNQNKTEAC